MQRNRRIARAAAAVLLAVGPVLFCAGPAYADNPWGSSYFPNVPLLTQDGKTVHFYDDLLKGKAVAINLIYTSCQNECPLETARLVQVQKLLGDHVGKDIYFYSISIDPKQDTPAVMKEYAKKFGAGAGWLFLTGKEEDVKLIGKKLGLSKSNDRALTDGHTPILMIGHEPTGQWMQNSAVDNPRFLAAQITMFMGWKNTQPSASYGTVSKQWAPDTAAYIFQSRCSPCHSIGKGDSVGPDLAGVTSRRGRPWLLRYLRAPDQLRAANDPIALALFEKYKKVPMPNLRLTDGEIAMLLAFLEAKSASVEQHEQHAHAPAPSN